MFYRLKDWLHHFSIHHIREEWNWHKMCQFHDGRSRVRPFWFVYWCCITVVKDLRCVVQGHKLEDESTVGPDSGDIALVCSRCGYTYHHQLY